MRIPLILVFLFLSLNVEAQRFIKTVRTTNELVALNPNDVHYTASVGGYGLFQYDSSSSATIDSKFVFKPTNYGGRWISISVPTNGGRTTNQFLYGSPSIFGDLAITNASPSILLHNSSAPADQKNWSLSTDGDEFYLDLSSDDGSSFSKVFSVLRSGASPVAVQIFTDLRVTGNITNEVLTPNRVVVTGAGRNLESSVISSTQLSYLSNLTSDVQGQLSGKVDMNEGSATNLDIYGYVTVDPASLFSYIKIQKTNANTELVIESQSSGQVLGDFRGYATSGTVSVGNSAANIWETRDKSGIVGGHSVLRNSGSNGVSSTMIAFVVNNHTNTAGEMQFFTRTSGSGLTRRWRMLETGEWVPTSDNSSVADLGVSTNRINDINMAGTFSNAGKMVLPSQSLQSLSAGSTISVTGSRVRVQGSGGAVTLTSVPTIAAGSDGQKVLIIGISDTNTLTVQDHGTLAGSLLQLGAASRTLGKGDILILDYDSNDGFWYEAGFFNN